MHVPRPPSSSTQAARPAPLLADSARHPASPGAAQQLAVDQGASPHAAACAFDLQRALDARSPSLSGRLARALCHTEHYLQERGGQLSSLDRELLLHWMTEADARLSVLRRASPAVERLLRSLTSPADPVRPGGYLARTLDLQQAIVDAEAFLDSQRGQRVTAVERDQLEAALEAARGWLSAVHG